MRLRDKVAIVVGGGQTPGETIGNGRATALLFAREGARVLAVDRDSRRRSIRSSDRGGGRRGRGVLGRCTDEGAVEAAIAECVARFGRVDVLHNNVGISLAGGDAPWST